MERLFQTGLLQNIALNRWLITGYCHALAILSLVSLAQRRMLTGLCAACACVLVAKAGNALRAKS